jgi:uncharacterized protein YcaQ
VRAAISRDEARRIALAAQGFDRPRPTGRVDSRQVRRTIHQLGLLQLDYVNVLTPAQYQVLFSRLGSYRKNILDDLVYHKREFTERWAHEASIVPMESWGLLRHRMEEHPIYPSLRPLLRKHADYVDWVLDEVEARGPLSAGELPEPEGTARRKSAWWSRSVTTRILEVHFGRGLLSVAHRLNNFARVYDATERVVPQAALRNKPKRDEAQRGLLLQAARSHGVGTTADLADYFRMRVPEARVRVRELVEAGALHEVQVEGWPEPGYLHPEARLPRRVEAAALLSPFDPVIWFRERAKRLFDFEYRIEIYVPQPKRRYGYYVLPFLLGDRLVARVDLKADRKARRLRVLAAYHEADVDRGAVAEALAAELRTMATWLELDSVAATARGNLARPLAAAVRE